MVHHEEGAARTQHPRHLPHRRRGISDGVQDPHGDRLIDRASPEGKVHRVSPDDTGADPLARLAEHLLGDVHTEHRPAEPLQRSGDEARSDPELEHAPIGTEQRSQVRRELLAATFAAPCLVVAVGYPVEVQ